MLKKSMKCIVVFFIFTAFLAINTLAQSIPQSQVFTVVGIATIVNNDKNTARNKAIEDALRKSVEHSVGTFVSSETMAQRFQLLSDGIYAKTKGYIQNYRILSELPDEYTYKLHIESKVALEILKKDLEALDILRARRHKPKVIVLMAEQRAGQGDYSFWWGNQASETDFSIAETILVEKLREENFNIVDHAAETRDPRINEGYPIAILDDTAALSLGMQYNADMVVVGKAAVEYAEPMMSTSVKSFKANASARAILIDNRTVIASAVTSGVAVHSDEGTGGGEALKNAAYALASQLVAKMKSVWNKDAEQTTTIQVTLNGVSSYRYFKEFKNVLQEQVQGVEGIHQRRMMAGVFTVDLDIKGNARSLADDLEMSSFLGFSVLINTVTENSIDLTLVPENH